MSKEKIPYKIYLDETEIPKAWYNLRADMKTSGPLLNPGTLEPMTAAELARAFFATSLWRRSLTTPLPISKFPKRYAVFIRCTVRLPLSVHIALRKSSARRPKFIINSRVTTPAEATS